MFRLTKFSFPLVILLGMHACAGESIDSQWLRPGCDSYGEAGNWDPAVVPLNGDDSFQILIPQNGCVNYLDLTGSIDTLSMDTGSVFSMNDAALFVDTSLTVLESARIGGDINVAGESSFTASGAETQFLGGRSRISATNGGQVSIAAPEYSSSGLTSETTIISSSGAGSLVDLSSMTSLDGGFDDQWNVSQAHSIVSTRGGIINLSSLQAITKPARGEDRLELSVTSEVNAETRSRVDLSSLTTISGAGWMRITADRGTVDLGPLATATGTAFVVRNGGSVSTASQGISGAGFDSTRFDRGETILSSSGTGSLLDLSSFASFSASFNDEWNVAQDQIVTATLGAEIDLSGVTTLTAPTRAEDGIRFNVSEGASLDMSALRSVMGPEAGRGRTVFSVDDGTVLLGPLERMDRARLTLDGDARVTIGNSQNPAVVTGSTFAVAGGSHLDGGGLAGTYSSADLSQETTIFTSSGIGSALDLSSLTRIDASFDDQWNVAQPHRIVASGSGAIDLASVETIIKPARAEDRLDLTVSTDENAETLSRVDLSSLSTISGTGLMQVNVARGTLTLGPLADVTGTTFNVTGGGAVTTSGQSVAGDGFSTTRFVGGETILRANGDASLLDLSSLSRLDASFDDQWNVAQNQLISASVGGTIDLSGIEMISAPARAEDGIRFQVSSGGHMDLSSLDEVVGAGETRITVGQGTLTMGPLSRPERVTIDLAAQASMTAPNELSLGPGVRLQIDVAEDDHSRIAVQGHASLGGILEIDLAGDFVPSFGAEFQILAHGSRSENDFFGSVEGAVLSNNLALGQRYDLDGVSLVATIPGDANFDFRVDPLDLNALGQSWLDDGQGWPTGDFNGDGMVDASDLNLLASNWLTSVTPAAAAIVGSSSSIPSVPESSGFALFGIGLCTLGLARRSVGQRH